MQLFRMLPASRHLRRFLTSIGTTLRILEEGTPWANKAELYIGLIKEAVRKNMKASNCPLAFWDYCVERRARIHNLTAKDMFSPHGTNPHTALTGDVGDISNLCQYDFYEWCYFREHGATFPHDKEVLGRILGPAKGAGNEMPQWILKVNGNVVPRRTHRRLQTSEIHSPTEQAKRTIFNQLIERRWSQSINKPVIKKDDDDLNFEEFSSPEEDPRKSPDIEDAVDANGRLINQNPAYDRLIHAEVTLQLDDRRKKGKVTQRVVGPEGEQAGKYDDNPMLNSIMYEVEFDDGTVREYNANTIAENMLTQVDSDGFSKAIMKGIIDY